nr:uncharacterized protein LOC117682889 [Crassostrea gigas]
MAQLSDTPLLILSITSLITGCSGSVSNISKTNWRDAQGLCRTKGSISSVFPHALRNEMYFWTAFYTRLSAWIKIIGCYEESAVNTVTRKSYEMYFPSAGLCQEICFASSYSVFGVQLKKCVCLEQIPGQWRRGADDCSLSCSGKYPYETSNRFQNECGGHQTYNLFKSGSEMENSLLTTEACVSIQCQGDQRFIEQECNEVIAQICNQTLYTEYNNWQSTSAECKLKHNSYLFGDVDLTDPRRSCDLIQGQPQGPSWLGIAKELYVSTYEVKDDIDKIKRKPSISNPKKCLKCNKLACTFADCNEFNYYVCLPMHGSISTTPTATTTSTHPQGTISTSTTQTGNTNVSMVVVPVSVIVILGLVAQLLVILWRRRQTEMTGETNNVQYKPDLTKYSEKSDSNFSLQNDKFVLEKMETYSLVNCTYHAEVEDSRSPYEECYGDDGYEYINENLREIVEDNNDYHDAFFPSNEGESDYGVRNRSDECQIENPYNHTNTGEYHVVLADNEYNRISFNAVV